MRSFGKDFSGAKKHSSGKKSTVAVKKKITVAVWKRAENGGGRREEIKEQWEGVVWCGLGRFWSAALVWSVLFYALPLLCERRLESESVAIGLKLVI